VAYLLLLALGGLDAAGYSVIVPVAPAIAEATGAGPAMIGLLVASFPTGMVAGVWLAGKAVQRRGVRSLLAASLLVVAFGSLGFVLGDSLAVYFPLGSSWASALAVSGSASRLKRSSAGQGRSTSA
jgi:MFS family permease